MCRRLIRACLTLLAFALVAGIAQFLYLAWRIGQTGSHDRARPADAVIVLGARVEPSGDPGPDLRSRTFHAVELFQHGLAPYLICTGGYQGDRMSAAAVAKRLAISQGVPADRILIADGSMTTSQDAARAARLMASRGMKTAILVSHPLHLERARLLFEAQGVSVYPSPTTTDLQGISWHTRAWLTTREALGIVWIGLTELGVPDRWTPSIGRWLYGWTLSTGTR